MADERHAMAGGGVLSGSHEVVGVAQANCVLNGHVVKLATGDAGAHSVLKVLLNVAGSLIGIKPELREPANGEGSCLVGYVASPFSGEIEQDGLALADGPHAG